MWGRYAVWWPRRRVSLAQGELRVRDKLDGEAKAVLGNGRGKMAREGVVGAKGKPPTRRSVWKVWKRVLRDVAAERERELAEEAECVAKERELLTGVPAKKYPRDLPKHWAPDTVEPSPRGYWPNLRREASSRYRG